MEAEETHHSMLWHPLKLPTAVQGGGSWLFPLQNGAPPIGWHDATAYLILPVLLVVSQYVSQKIISPPSNDPSQQSTQWILKFLPLMIGEALRQALYMGCCQRHARTAYGALECAVCRFLLLRPKKMPAINSCWHL